MGAQNLCYLCILTDLIDLQKQKKFASTLSLHVVLVSPIEISI